MSERCADLLVRRAGDLGLPKRPATLRREVPAEIVGERVVVPVPVEKRVSKRRRRAVAG